MLELVGILECFNTYDQGDIYFEISNKILQNYNSLNLKTVQSFADSLHISVSTANRYIKQLYFENFSEFRNWVRMTEELYHFDGKYVPNIEGEAISLNEFFDLKVDTIGKIIRAIDNSKIEKIISMIMESENIIFLGIPMISDVWRLQMELILMGKKTNAFINPNYQVQEVLNMKKNSLVICLQHIRQQDGHNEKLILAAKEKGAKVAYIGNVKVDAIEKNADASISYRGSNTNLDTRIAQILINYIGTCLRNTIVK